MSAPSRTSLIHVIQMAMTVKLLVRLLNYGCYGR